MSIADPHLTANARPVTLPRAGRLGVAEQMLALIALALVTLGLATWTWGLVALTMTALVAVPLMFVLLIRITRG